MDLALNNLQRLLCHKTQPTNHLTGFKQMIKIELKDSYLIEMLEII